MIASYILFGKEDQWCILITSQNVCVMLVFEYLYLNTERTLFKNILFQNVPIVSVIVGWWSYRYISVITLFVYISFFKKIDLCRQQNNSMNSRSFVKDTSVWLHWIGRWESKIERETEKKKVRDRCCCTVI